MKYEIKAGVCGHGTLKTEERAEYENGKEFKVSEEEQKGEFSHE